MCIASGTGAHGGGHAAARNAESGRTMQFMP